MAASSRYGKEETKPSEFPQHASDHAQHLLQLWGLLALLNGYQTKLSRVRDSNILSRASKRSTVESLWQLASLASSTRDIQPIVAELTEDQEIASPIWSRFAEDFKPQNTKFNGSDSLAISLSNHIRKKARRIGATERVVSELITQNSGILSAYENVRIQEYIRRLTILIFVLTIATLLFAAENSGIVRDVWMKLFG